MALGDTAAIGELAPVGQDGAASVTWDSAAHEARPWIWLLRIALGKNTLALIDQAVVSGTSFLTTVLLARWASVDELGIYSLGFSLLVAWTCAQDALIAAPYTIYCHRAKRGAQAEYAGNVLILQGLLSALAVLVLAIGVALIGLVNAMPEMVAVVGVLTAVTPFVLLREFGRRYAFARLHMFKALGLDMVVAALQLAVLGGLAWSGALSAATALVALGGACALAGTIWLFLARDQFVIRLGQVGRTMRQSWGLGKWIFASQLASFVQGYISYWILAWTVGTAATGIFTACMTVALLSNPLILGLSNIFAPRAALAFAKGGAARLRHDTYRDTLLLGAAMALFAAVILLIGEQIMSLLYRGPQYVGHGHTVTVLALAILASAVGIPASNGLAVIERPDAIFRIALFAVALSAVLIWFMVARWGLAGAAYGYLAGNVASSAGRWIVFLALVPKPRPQAAPAVE